LVDLVGATDDAEAWDQLFRHSNQSRGIGNVGYQTNETVVIKLNLNMATKQDYTGNGGITSPQVALNRCPSHRWNISASARWGI